MILVAFRTQSLHWRVSLARELSQYSFRVSRVLVKRVQLSQAPDSIAVTFALIGAGERNWIPSDLFQ